MTTPRPCMCYVRGCLYFWGKVGPPDDPVYVCRAFPLGIPEDIVTGVNGHNAPEAGQDGDIVYSPGGNRPQWADRILGVMREKGGAGSGNWGHAGRPGARGGSAAGTGGRRNLGQPAGGGRPSKVGMTQVGITSHRAGRTPAQALEAAHEWQASLDATTAKNPRVALGIGGFQGGREPTYVTTYEGNGEALKAAARFGKKYNQDAVIVQKFVAEGTAGAEPIDELSFGAALTTQQIRKVEKVIGSEGVGGWTWSRDGAGNSRLQMTFIPDWADYDRAGHSERIRRIHGYVNNLGTPVSRARDWVNTQILYGPDGYDSVIGKADLVPFGPIPFGPKIPFYTLGPDGTTRIWVEEGGPTSGNWGHAGRPGARGGSAPGGGHAFFGVDARRDRGKLGGHSYNDLLGMATARRRLMNTKHPGTELGNVKPGWENRVLIMRREKAKEAAKAQAQRNRWAAKERAKQAKEEEIRKRADPAVTREALSKLEKEHVPYIAAKATLYNKAQDDARAIRQEIDRKTERVLGDPEIDPKGRTVRYYKTVPGPGVSEAEIVALKEQYNKVANIRSEAGRDLSHARAAYLEAQQKLVMVDSPMTVAHNYRARWSAKDGNRKEMWDTGRLGFESLVSTDLQADPLAVDFRKGGRGRSFQTEGKGGKNEIHLSTTAGPGTVIHELGHALEGKNTTAQLSARAFLNYRTGGDNAKSLRSVTGIRGYKSRERTKADKFMDPYMGKIYSWGSTEILSMGLEYMYSKPAAFAKGDPEMFDMIYNVARGIQWKPPTRGG